MDDATFPHRLQGVFPSQRISKNANTPIEQKDIRTRRNAPTVWGEEAGVLSKAQRRVLSHPNQRANNKQRAQRPIAVNYRRQGKQAACRFQPAATPEHLLRSIYIESVEGCTIDLHPLD